MKVTVCFGDIRIVVPCGTGDLLVRELINEAIRRYKKATGKDSDSCVIVHHLHSQSGILDPDDRVNDVADDREKIFATYDDNHGPEPSVPQGGGDGASGSSVGTGSPDIFRGVTDTKYPSENVPHIEVMSSQEHLQCGLGLQVRRGSEPSLNQIGVTDQQLINTNQNIDHTKRWSAAPVCRNDTDPPERILTNSHINNTNINNNNNNNNNNHSNNNSYIAPPWRLEESELEDSQNENIVNNFSRSGRLSMQFLGDGAGYRWMDAAERLYSSNNSFTNHQQYNSKSLPRELKRKEPLGQAYESIREKNEEMLLILNEQKGPLGLTAIPDSEQGGLLVQYVEPGSRAERGRLRRGDRILEINGVKLVGLSEVFVQNCLRKSLSDPELRLRVLRADKKLKGTKISEMVEANEKQPNRQNIATISPSRKVPGAPIGASLQVANTRKLGRRIEISLKKGPLGLGFSVTTRDNPAGGDCPIYIKNILPRGAAIEDGRLRPGDRLLEVDNIPMTGKTQTEVVQILRATQTGATVKIVVSRQQELAENEKRESVYDIAKEQPNNTPPKPPPPVLPQKPAKQKINDSPISIKSLNDSFNETILSTDSKDGNDFNSMIPWKNREILTLHIPVHDTEKAGLGVSVKGKTGSPNTSNGNITQTKFDGDLGIFIKSVIHGGAASRDGRLKMNDQLLNVNGISLLGQSNAEATETLRRAMLKSVGKFPGMITLTIARRISRSNSSTEKLDTDSSTTNISDKSGSTVIYLNSDDKHSGSKDGRSAIFNNSLKNSIRNKNIHNPTNPNNNQGNLNQNNDNENNNNNNNNLNNEPNKRWSNPVLDRLTGGSGMNNMSNSRPSPLMIHGLRNDSYYMATNECWSPRSMNGNQINNSVLIEEDPEPSSPAIQFRPSLDNTSSAHKSNKASTPTTDVTYASQLSLDTNPPLDAFSRDAVGRRSISEKHHAALDAKETGTYQRNRKLREEREREKNALSKKGGGSVESLTGIKRINSGNNQDYYSEALDNVGELGPSLGLKKSSSLESLQTMVQEIQMSDEPRGPIPLRTPRGRGREETLRAAVERPPENQARKHWLLEDAQSDSEGGFISRSGPLQSSLHDRKNKIRQKKPSILKGIGHMFRFGKHRKDGVIPIETLSEFSVPNNNSNTKISNTNNVNSNNNSNRSNPENNNQHIYSATLPLQSSLSQAQPQQSNLALDRKGSLGPPMYQPPPPVSNNGIQKNDLFNHRYSHYVNYEELQQQISRRHQHYHSQRSVRNDNSNHHQRPVSSYYEYETIQEGSQKKINIPNTPPIQWNSTSNRNRGPFITQVTIRNLNHSSGSQPPASQV